MRKAKIYLAVSGLLLAASTLGALPLHGAPKAATKARSDLAKNTKLGDNCFALFNFTTPRHDLTNAYLLSLASDLVYPGGIGVKNTPTNPRDFQKKFRDTFGRYGMKELKFLDNKRTSTELMVMSNDKVVVVSFRGTETDNARELFLDGLKTDADLKLKGQDRLGKGIKIHEGFWIALDSVYADLVREITRQGGFKSKKLFLTGHSLGGALATLCGLRLFKDGNGKATVYTYGCPRVGNEAFRKAYSSVPLYRWVNRNDIVPMVPPEVIGYRHVGTLNNITTNGGIKLNDRESKGIGSVPHHACSQYCLALFKNLPARTRSKMPAPPNR
jgi:hypothetical protein